jgi:hypothetical protein
VHAPGGEGNFVLAGRRGLSPGGQAMAIGAGIRLSKWEFVTSASTAGSGSIKALAFSAEEGHLILKSPSGTQLKYYYFYVGVGPKHGRQFLIWWIERKLQELG